MTAPLVPTLRSGDTLTLDNPGAQKVAGVREAIKVAGARLLCLLLSSPVFNPIERAFAKRKAVLFSAPARTVSDHRAASHTALTRLSPEESRNDRAAAS